ncbi:heme-binding protein [Agrobacterium sp. S2]|nr:heme-binding protein [Agrobacterium sp. S2]
MNPRLPTLAELLEEQERLRISTFDYHFAWRLGSELRKRAIAANLPIAVEVRHGNDIVFATLLPGATVDNSHWAKRKCAVVQRFHKSSLYMKLLAAEQGYDLNERFRLPTFEFSPSGGALPLLLKGGVFVGSVVVSGLPDVEDHMLVADCLAELL